MPPERIDPDDLPPTVLASDASSEKALEIEYDEELYQVGTSIGCYEISEKLSHGGMGIVYRAIDTTLCRDVAIKILRDRHGDLDGLRQRFLDEARVTGRLQHPGIVPIYEMGETKGGTPFFAMKLVEGNTLADILASTDHSARDRSRHLQIFHQVCQTVAYAHSRGVIHLDLKPSNIMVGEFGEVHVMDWGLCRSLMNATSTPDSAVRAGAAKSGRTDSIENDVENAKMGGNDVDFPLPTPTDDGVLGTPAYMAPEQARGESVSPLSDVFGLGAVLCEILTGYPPFRGKDWRDVYRRASRGKIGRAIKALNESAREEPLLQLAKHCLEIDPANRPCDASVVAAEIDAFLETALQRAEHDLTRFFEISMDMFCIASLDGYFRRVNANFSRVLGFSDTELVSRPFMDYVHPDDIEGTLNAMTTLSGGNPVVQFRNRYRDSQGQYHWMEWTAKSIPEDNIVFAVARDITASVTQGSR